MLITIGLSHDTFVWFSEHPLCIFLISFSFSPFFPALLPNYSRLFSLVGMPAEHNRSCFHE